MKQQAVRKNRTLHSVLRRLGILLVLALLVYAFAYGANNRIDISEYTYETDQLSVSFDGFRIVHLTDLHNKVFAQNNESLLREVRNLKPDIIVMTGDFIDASNHTNIDRALMFMQEIPKIAPSYFVYGNHEHRLGKTVTEAFARQITEYGVHFMSDEALQVPSKTGQTFTLIGLDDKSLQANILQQLVDASTDDFRVLLAHEPQYLESFYAETGVDLIFSGHAHGGQFRIPFTGRGLFAPDQGFFPKYTGGVYTAKDSTMYLSRGLGNSAFPLRICNHPEIVCVTLKTVSGRS